MATFNGGAFIERQLASFVDQELLPDELVVTDDGSTDRTVEIVHDFASSAPFAVRVERNPIRLGYTGNFERAIGLTRGDLILISDQDDEWYRDKISTVVRTIRRQRRPTVTVNDQLLVDAQGVDQGKTMFGNFRRAGFPETDLIAGSCTALPRAFFPILFPFPENIPYDSWIGAVADSLGLKVLIERPLQTFRRHDANASQPIVAVSSPTRWSAFRRYGFMDPRAGWKNEIAWRSALIERLETHSMDSALAGDRASRAVQLNRRRINALIKRRALIEIPRWRRPWAIARAWRSGLYDEFLGLRSALKDLMRR